MKSTTHPSGAARLLKGGLKGLDALSSGAEYVGLQEKINSGDTSRRVQMVLYPVA